MVNENLTYLEQINNSIIHLEVNSYKNDNEILAILGVNYSDYTSITTIENNYIDNYTTVGKFNVKYEFTNTDYTKKIININVLTYDNNESEYASNDNNGQEIVSKNKKKDTIFNKIFSFFNDIFIRIINFFKNLFS